MKAGNVVTSVVLADMSVHIAAPGSVAIASYRIDVGNRRADGRTTQESAWETDVWVLRNGVWKVTQVQYGLAVPPPQ